MGMLPRCSSLIRNPSKCCGNFTTFLIWMRLTRRADADFLCFICLDILICIRRSLPALFYEVRGWAVLHHSNYFFQGPLEREGSLPVVFVVDASLLWSLHWNPTSQTRSPPLRLAYCKECPSKIQTFGTRRWMEWAPKGMTFSKPIGTHSLNLLRPIPNLNFPFF